MSQITTHILDTSIGKPAKDVAVTLYQRDHSNWREIGSGCTNSDGRVTDLLSADLALSAGHYKLSFQTEPYYQSQQITCFFPYVEIVFQIADDGRHYHVPLLLNPFGYSTYRGS